MANPYESGKLLSEYLFFHYATPDEVSGGLPVPESALDFPVRVVRELIDPLLPAARALDVGCAVGRSSFELARTVPLVVGVDFSSAFIAAAIGLKTIGSAHCTVVVEGTNMKDLTVSVPVDVDRSRVDFQTGDAMDLPCHLEQFVVVLAANLICRLPEPKKFLSRLPALVRPGGQLLLATPFSWLQEYTPEAHWLGGRDGGGASFEVLRSILEPHFELQLTKELPFLIREHARKFQYCISLGSRWIRRSD